MSRRGALLFAAMCVIWGIPYLLIKVAVDDMSPSMLVLGRTVLAALLLLPIAAIRGELRPLLPFWAPLVAFAAITKAAVFTVFLAFWLSGVVTTLGLLVVLPHLVLAAIFAWWLGREVGEVRHA